MIVLMCHGITLYPCWLHVCQGTKLKYTCQHIDTGSCVGRWPSAGLCHRPRVGEYWDLWALEEFCRLSWSKTLSFHLSLWLPSLWIWSQAQKLLPIHVDMIWHRSYFGQIMIVLMCHGIILYPCWLHVCQGSKLKYTCQHIDTGSGVGRWPSTGLCHRPRVGEYCSSIGMPLPFRSGYYGGRFSCSIFWRSCNPLRFCALFVPCPQAEDSLHEY